MKAFQQLAKNDIQNLIIVGKSEQPIDQKLLLPFKHRDFINRLHWSTWKEFANELSNDDLVDLFKGLVIVERELKWMGGSVAAAIWIFKILFWERGVKNITEIADFGKRNSDNPYIPFGTSHHRDIWE